MTLKVTVLLVIAMSMFSCSNEQPSDIALQQQLDSIASVSIDSAYKIIHSQCDTNLKYRLPVLVDSMLRADTLQR
jgi:hypothetical protein